HRAGAGGAAGVRGDQRDGAGGGRDLLAAGRAAAGAGTGGGAAAAVRPGGPANAAGRAAEGLDRGPRDRAARQQTLRATIAWSHALLTPGEQQLFRRLAVFQGGAALEAIAAVCNATGDLMMDVPEGVEALVNHSL